MRSILSLTLCGIFLADRLYAEPEKSTPIEFNRDIRPILADTCFHCHGPDSARRKAGLRFDLEDAAKATKDGRAAIVPGKPTQSELIRRILSKEHGEQMPPPASGRQLTPLQKETLRRWIAEGAKWQKHWAFIPPSRPELPSLKQEAPASPIDRFILARLEREGLKPSPEAAKATLIRRLSLDLTGLPPTIEEVDAYLQDTSANAYEKVVDRLLASPRYGERMTWRWLEAARYADTHGYQTDGERDMYRWRDWVIDAYNRNLPYDQFTMEQIAGDLLPDATLDQKIATGFNRNHRGNSEGGIVPEEYAVEYVVDRVETTATVWLGLTLGCARCHDHKYDPFSQREFYQLFAYFNSIPEKGRAVKLGNSPPLIKAPTKEQANRREELDKCRKEAWNFFENQLPMIEVARDRWATEVDSATLPDWNITDGLIANLRFDEKKWKTVDGIVRATDGKKGKAFDFDGKGYVDAGDVGDFGFDDKFTIAFWIKPRQLNGAILSRMTNEPQGDGYSVHLVDGHIQVHLTKRWLDDALRVQSKVKLRPNEWQHVVVTYDGSRSAAGTDVLIDGKKVLAGVSTTPLLDELNQSFKTKEPFRLGTAGSSSQRFDGLLDDVRIYNRVLEFAEKMIVGRSHSLSEILKIPVADRGHWDQAKLTYFYIQNAAPKKMREAFTAAIQADRERDAFEESLPTVMVMEELSKPRDAHILLRGEYDKRGEKVARAVPTAISAFPKDAPNNRLGLTKWLVDPANPLTARVAVNRIWQLHFGTGLVKTVEDFGTQGEFPSHPELLDWLATEFIRTGWDVKKMHKIIVMSATYRQSSRVTTELRARDPDNRMLTRGPRYRLSAETVRDQALYASGLLVEKLGGKSVKPYQPAGLWKELSGADDYTPDKGENLYRRSLYTYWKRTVAPPTLATFDASGRETCWVRETRTNTPLQALTLLNDVTYVEASRMLAQRVFSEATEADQRIERAFRLVVSRMPSDAERIILRRSLDLYLAEYRNNPAAAKKLLQIGEKPADAKINAGELAAYMQVCSLILNLDEAVTKE